MRTVKELRASLLAEKVSWTINPSLKDDMEIPQYTTGAKTDKLILSSKLKALDFKMLLDESASNTLVQERRIDRGIIAKEVNAVTPQLRPSPETTPIAGAPVSGIPVSVDWRNRWNWPWITSVRDQNGFPACWCFAAVALVEAMVRIEHCAWPWISEGDVHKGMGAKAGDYGNPKNALDWIKKNGAADPDCFPWPVNDNVPYTPTTDRNGRTVRISSYTEIGNVVDQKRWIDTVGPITTYFLVYNDFFAYGNGVYRRNQSASNGIAGGHCMLIVGYDDSPGQQCWIVKNSWGPNWGDHGYARIAYGQCQIDEYAKIGLRNTNPDPWTKRRMHNGGMLESSNGANHRNFELVTTAPGAKIRLWWRDNNVAGIPWKANALFGSNAAANPTLTQTTYDRNLECVYVNNSRRLHHWWRPEGGGDWRDGGIFGPTDAVGVPGFIQANYGAPGNFELVVRTADNKLCHWYRMGGVWYESVRFASNVAFSGASLVQSHYGTKDNFELVCVLSDGQMQHWWRDNDNNDAWKTTVKFGSGVSSPPCMIEGVYGSANERSVGNFELCVAVGGKVQHWWRNNVGDGNWYKSATFGHDVKSVISLIQGSYGFYLEVIVLRTDNKLQHYWRDGAGWKEGVIIGSI